MALKVAKSAYTRDEVLDLLRHNADLYRHEPGFAEYYLQLTVYLISRCPEAQDFIPASTPLPTEFAPQALNHTNSDIDPINNVPTPLPVSRPAVPVAPPVQRPAISPVPPSASRPTVALGRPVAPAPPPAHQQPPGARHSGITSRSGEESSHYLPSRDAVPKPFLGGGAPAPPRPVTPPINVSQSPLQTPLSGPLSRTSREVPMPSRIALSGVSQGGASLPTEPVGPPSGVTKVFRVVRPYKSPTSMQVPCRHCGTMMAADAMYCPSCGQPNTR